MTVRHTRRDRDIKGRQAFLSRIKFLGRGKARSLDSHPGFRGVMKQRESCRAICFAYGRHFSLRGRVV